MLQVKTVVLSCPLPEVEMSPVLINCCSAANKSAIIDYRKAKKQASDYLVPLTKVSGPSALRCGVANCRSVQNKVEAICDLTVESELDCLALTEAWRSDKEEENNAVISSVMPRSYDILHVLRRTGGRSVYFIYNKQFST